MTSLILVVLALAAICFMVRLVLGPTLPDRVIAMDGLIVTGVATIAVRAMQTGDGAFLPVLVVLTLVGFVSTAAAARFVEWRSIELRDVSDHVDEHYPGGDDDGTRGDTTTAEAAVDDSAVDDSAVDDRSVDDSAEEPAGGSDDR
jgi:multisubunit Na+/H+ antiporter MnhF subunit